MQIKLAIFVVYRYYTVRYRERNRKWNYQTCPTSNTVIDNLKPNTPYEFGVRPSKNERMGTWSKSVLHNAGVDGILLVMILTYVNGEETCSL